MSDNKYKDWFGPGYGEWFEICIEFCKKNGFNLLFVNSNNFGFVDKEGKIHHVFDDELVNWL